MSNNSNAMLVFDPVLAPSCSPTSGIIEEDEQNSVNNKDLSRANVNEKIPSKVADGELELKETSAIEDKSLKELAKVVLSETDQTRQLRINDFHRHLKVLVKN